MLLRRPIVSLIQRGTGPIPAELVVRSQPMFIYWRRNGAVDVFCQNIWFSQVIISRDQPVYLPRLIPIPLL